MRKAIVVRIVLLWVVFSFLPESSSFGNEQKEMEMREGYTKKIQIPNEGLSQNETKMMGVIQRVNNEILSKEKDVEVIANSLLPIFSELWGNLIDTSISIEFGTSQTPKKRKYISDIFVNHTDKKRMSCQFMIRSPSATESNWEKTVEVVVLACPELTEGTAVYFIFYLNGNLKELGYRNQRFAQVRVIKNWSEDGVLLEEKILEKPIPFQIWKR